MALLRIVTHVIILHLGIFMAILGRDICEATRCGIFSTIRGSNQLLLPIGWRNVLPGAFLAICRSYNIIETLVVLRLLLTLLCAEGHVWFWLLLFGRLLDSAHFLQNVVVQITTFTELAANIQVALLFPRLDDAYAVLGVWILDRVEPLLVDGADEEGLGNFLSATVTVAHAHILVFLFFNRSEHPITLISDFIGDAELPLTNLLYHIELRIKSIALLERLWDEALGTRVEDKLVRAWTDLYAWQI